MAEASIPVDLFNPGQVFASLGFLEGAEGLLGEAEGGFDWSDEADVRFRLRASGNDNPFEVVLQFLAEANIDLYVPVDYKDATPEQPSRDVEDSAGVDDLIRLESFPDRSGDTTALPIRLVRDERSITISHFADGSSRNRFRLYAGNRSAHRIALAMLRGTREKPTKKKPVGDMKTRGVDSLWTEQREELVAKPFDVLTSMGGSFNFDPRGAWTALDAGYSPNMQKHAIEASPIVEILAALAMEHARPDEYERRHVRYDVWSGLVPPLLARPALAGANVALPVRRLRFILALSGKNKIVTFAQEEIKS